MAYQQQTMTGARQTTRDTAVTRPMSGWVVGMAAFAGFMMVLVGAFWSIEGLAAIIEDEFFVVGPNYAYEIDTTTWGWIHLIGGIVLALAGFAVFSGALWARLVGILVTLAAATINFFYIPYYPVWSILIIAICIVTIWALAVYNPRAESEAYA